MPIEWVLLITNVILTGVITIVITAAGFSWKRHLKRIDDMSLDHKDTREKVLKHDENCVQYGRRLDKIDQSLKETRTKEEIDADIAEIRDHVEKTVVRIEEDGNHIKNDIRQLRDTYEQAYRGLEHHFKLVESSLASIAMHYDKK